MRIKKRLSAFIFSVLVFLGCVANKYSFRWKDLSGIYRTVSNRSVVLELRPDSSFLYVRPNGLYGREWGGPDTIAYGVWTTEVKNGLIVLSTPEALSRDLRIDAGEKSLGSQDTVYIEIDGPAEWDHQGRAIQYTAEVFAQKNHFLEEAGADGTGTILKLYNPGKEKIQWFQLILRQGREIYGIRPRPCINDGVKEVRTEVWAVKDGKANYFRVHIPDITGNFLSYRRLKRDFVRMVSPDKLEWDGDIFVKKRLTNN